MDGEVDRITEAAVDAAYRIHRAVGPGLVEAVYMVLLAGELERLGFTVERRVRLDVEINGVHFRRAIRPDLLMNGLVVIELKSVVKILPVHWKQTLTYIRLLDLRVGLLLNFGCATMKEGIHRVVNRYTPSPTSKLLINRPEADQHRRQRQPSKPKQE